MSTAPPNPPPGSNDPTGNPHPPQNPPPTPATEQTPAPKGDDGPHKHHGLKDALHKIEDEIGNAVGEAKFGE